MINETENTAPAPLIWLTTQAREYMALERADQLQRLFTHQEMALMLALFFKHQVANGDEYVTLDCGPMILETATGQHVHFGDALIDKLTVPF